MTMSTKWAIQPKIHQAHNNFMFCRVAIRCIIFHNCTTNPLYSPKLYFNWSYFGIMVRHCNWLCPICFCVPHHDASIIFIYFWEETNEDVCGFLWFCIAKIWWDFNELPLCFSLETYLMVHTKLYIIPFLISASLLCCNIKLEMSSPT